MYVKKFVQTLIFIGFMASTRGQGNQNIVPSIPTSPQAAAFQKYGDININHATGIPNIEIPLFNISHHSYEIPVSLKYNPLPLKPGYNYDVFGQGWSLSLNSCISRTIEGAPDENTNFQIEFNRLSDNYFYYIDSGPKINPPYTRTDFSTVNTAFDKFNAVLPDGSSFEFIIDGNTVKISDGRQVKITYSYSQYYNIYSFIVIDEKGIKYTFNEGDSPRPGSTQYQHYVSWKLSRIDLPDSPEPIVFNYNYTIVSPYDTACGESATKIEFGNNERGSIYTAIYTESEEIATNYTSYSNISYQMKLLSSITYGKTEMSLNYKDLNAQASYNYVENIRIRYNSSLIKQIDLTNSLYTIFSNCLQKPLARLNKISIKGSDPLQPSMSYDLEYRKNSDYYFVGTDHWGNYNTRNTEYDVANFNFFVPFDTSTLNFLYNARLSAVNKSPNEINPYDKIKLSQVPIDVRMPASAEDHGVLSKIKYPTGGQTEFEFENHRYLSSTNSNGDYVHYDEAKEMAYGSGFRIKKIINYATTGKIANVKNYRYGTLTDNNQHTGLGVAPVEPSILTYMDYTYFDLHNNQIDFIRKMILGLNEQGSQSFTLNPFLSSHYGTSTRWKVECNFSPQNFRKILGGKPAVLYPYVTVYHGDINYEGNLYTPEKTIGKTTYSYNFTLPGYDLTGRWSESVFFDTPFYVGKEIITNNMNNLYNNLAEKMDYKFEKDGFIPLKKYTYQYDNFPAGTTELLYSDIIPKPFLERHYNPYVTNEAFVNYLTFFLWSSRLSVENEINYFNNGNSLTITKNYQYNNRNQLVSTKTYNNTEILKENYKYPELELSGTTPAIIQSMLNKNIISPILETTITKSDTSPPYINDKTINGFKIDYFEFPTTNSSIIKPSETFNLEILPSGNTYTSKDKITKYSANGNPLEYLNKNATYSSYEYGYGDQYMVIKADNINYASLNSTINTSLPAGFSNLEALLNSFTTPNGNWTTFNTNLRNNLPANVLVTTYTYKPLVGITSITDPKNLIATYHYDSMGRLENIKDQDGNIIQNNTYKYKE